MSFNKSLLFLAIFACAAITLSLQARKNILEISTKQVFDIAVLRNNQRPVIVYFTRPSCGRGICAQIQAELEDLARENDSSMDLVIVDLEQNPELKETFEVKVIPTTRGFFKGNLEGQVRGPVRNSINNLVQRLIDTFT